MRDDPGDDRANELREVERANLDAQVDIRSLEKRLRSTQADLELAREGNAKLEKRVAELDKKVEELEEQAENHECDNDELADEIQDNIRDLARVAAELGAVPVDLLSISGEVAELAHEALAQTPNAGDPAWFGGSLALQALEEVVDIREHKFTPEHRAELQAKIANDALALIRQRDPMFLKRSRALPPPSVPTVAKGECLACYLARPVKCVEHKPRIKPKRLPRDPEPAKPSTLEDELLNLVQDSTGKAPAVPQDRSPPPTPSKTPKRPRKRS